MAGTIVVVYLVVLVAVYWLFYKWGASISEKKGRSRAMGWWAVVGGFIGIFVLYILPDLSVMQYAPPQPSAPPKANVSEKLARLASLLEKGALTQEEFEKAKADALASN